MTNTDEALDALHDLRGTLLALECVTRAFKHVQAHGHSEPLATVIQQQAEVARVGLLYEPLPERVLAAFEREVGKFVSTHSRGKTQQN
ncbi:hypothetical protein [Caldimonas tepidiphila]|uniref:hypothetical protein n=1 Tax=Caldimonas tepidiphila TaxID=2315841 RepID=UPI000E5A2F5E|nr:hypothetical protein [Caldimonas tepidiphila]